MDRGGGERRCKMIEKQALVGESTKVKQVNREPPSYHTQCAYHFHQNYVGLAIPHRF